MIPESLIIFSERKQMISPHYLHSRDCVWLQSLMRLYAAFEGKSLRALKERLRAENSQADRATAGKRRLAIHILNQLCLPRRNSPSRIQKIREALFAEARGFQKPRAVALADASARLKLSVEEIEESLFSDLSDERKLGRLNAELSAQNLALVINSRLAQGILFRASDVTLHVEGNSRAVVRHAKWKGLMCSLNRTSSDTKLMRLHISGPYSLFRRTLIYGRALSELLPILQWCPSYSLSAECILRGKPLLFRSNETDPLFPSKAPKPFDSRIEERFTKDFERLGSDFEIIREPAPIEAGHTFVFPDFLLRHRRDPSKFWYLEIIGFWTPQYLANKLAKLREAKLSKIILCVSEKLNCGKDELPNCAHILFYRKTVDAKAVLTVLEGVDAV